MKKLYALILAVVFAVTLCTPAFAAKTDTVDQFVTFDTDASTDFYNPGNTVYVNFRIGDVSLDGIDGVSSVEFELYYDSELVEPVIFPSADDDGDSFNFESILLDNPGDGWDVFGSLDTDNSRYVIGLADFYATAVLLPGSEMNISIPFTVKSTARVDDIVFSFENAMAYNADLSKGCAISVDDIVVRYALQPDSVASLPANAIPLDIAGYKHGMNNVVYFTNEEITVADYVSKFMDPVNNQDQMKSFGVLIVSHIGEIIESDLSDADKSEIVIPADSYIIGIYSDNTDDISAIETALARGSSVTLYNLNIEATVHATEGTALTAAGFSVKEFATEDGANAYIDYDNRTVTVYEEKITVGMLDDMIKGSVTVYNEAGSLVSGSTLVRTGDVIDYLDGFTVIILGDVNKDGKVNQFDCYIIKSYILNGNVTLSDAATKAACINTSSVSMFSYLAIKSRYFGRVDFTTLNPNKK